MTVDTHNWSSSAHQELYKIVKDENFPIVNQVDARLQNFEIQFLREAAKFVGDFKSLAKEADESLAKHKALELEIESLLKSIVSQDIMSVVQNNSVGNTSNLQTELDRMKERFEKCITKKENEYAKLSNDWYTKCEECKFDKISYDKAYNDMQQKIERLQAQLGDLKGKSKDTSFVSDTLNPLSQKLENENVELEFQDNTRGTSTNTKFAKQLILGKPPKLDAEGALSVFVLLLGYGLLVLVLSIPVEDKPFESEFTSFLVKTEEVLKGLILNIPGAITLSFFTTFDYFGVEIEFEVTGFDKA
nr:hypothetical protein [Tanacetum cinerariifolium]